MTNSAIIRPGWRPATIALMVLGFILFWPLGLAMLAYIIWGDRLDGFKRSFNDKADSAFGAFRGCRKNMGDNFNFGSTTGNAAFDEWRQQELDRLNEERRRLDEARAEFEAYADELRRARDKEEFDRFMSERRANAKKAPAKQPKADKSDKGEITDI